MTTLSSSLLLLTAYSDTDTNLHRGPPLDSPRCPARISGIVREPKTQLRPPIDKGDVEGRNPGLLLCSLELLPFLTPISPSPSSFLLLFPLASRPFPPTTTPFRRPAWTNHQRAGLSPPAPYRLPPLLSRTPSLTLPQACCHLALMPLLSPLDRPSSSPSRTAHDQRPTSSFFLSGMLKPPAPFRPPMPTRQSSSRSQPLPSPTQAPPTVPVSQRESSVDGRSKSESGRSRSDRGRGRSRGIVVEVKVGKFAFRTDQ